MRKNRIILIFVLGMLTVCFFASSQSFNNTSVANAQSVEVGMEEQLEHASSVYNDGSMATLKGEEARAIELFTKAFYLYLSLAEQGVVEAQ